MKKIFLCGLMLVVVSKLSFAQSEINPIEPSNIFSLNNTLWQLDDRNEMIGFYQGTVYACIDPTMCAPDDDSLYLTIIFISYFKMNIPEYSMYGLMFPLLGSGLTMVNDEINNEKENYSIRKIQDSWIPE